MLNGSSWGNCIFADHIDNAGLNTMANSVRSRLLHILSIFVLQCSAIAQVEFDSSNLPIIVISTDSLEIVDDPRIVASMGIINNGAGQVNLISDPFNDYTGKISIEYRGSTSQVFPKKSFSIETQYETGANRNVSLLGLPEENDWVLYAPFSDKTLIRNILSFHISRELGHYAPRTRLCELILNGEYQGVYVLIEKIKRDKNRVDIASLNPEEITGDDVTGGYIIKVDKLTGDHGPLWTSEIGGINFQYEYPGHDVIVQEQKTYIKGYVDDFEQALVSDGFTDPDSGYRRYLDVGSTVDLFIVNEFSKNIDGYFQSSFIFKDKESNGGKLTMGPVWDFNLAFGNADYRQGYATHGFQIDLNPEIWWWERLLQDPTFLSEIRNRWYTIRQDQLADEKFIGIIDSLTLLLNEAQLRNFEKWKILGSDIWPNYFIGESYEEEIEYLRTWAQARLNWLDNKLLTWSSTGIASKSPKNRVYPNPFSDHIRIDFTLDNPGTLSLTIYDIQGMQVDKIMEKVHFQKGDHRVFWHSTDLQPSVYLLVMSINGEKSCIRKIVKL